MGHREASHPELPAWLPPIFAAPCREPQTDAPLSSTIVPRDFLRKSLAPSPRYRQECATAYKCVSPALGEPCKSPLDEAGRIEGANRKVEGMASGTVVDLNADVGE